MVQDESHLCYLCAFPGALTDDTVIASFLRSSEETSVKPNSVFRVKILCMCEAHAGDRRETQV